MDSTQQETDFQAKAMKPKLVLTGRTFPGRFEKDGFGGGGRTVYPSHIEETVWVVLRGKAYEYRVEREKI